MQNKLSVTKRHLNIHMFTIALPKTSQRSNDRKRTNQFVDLSRMWNTFLNFPKAKCLAIRNEYQQTFSIIWKKHRHPMQPPCNESKTRSGKNPTRKAISMFFMLHHAKQETHFNRCDQPTGLRTYTKTLKIRSNTNWNAALQQQNTTTMHMWNTLA